MAASFGELSESLQRRVKLVMGFFLAFGEPVDASANDVSQGESLSSTPAASSIEVDNTSIFGMGRS